ncbi:MAG TPA: hypothetical protein VF529_09630 [Solirubrobacteraceae bacterium]|jgi:hypothetical protein
MRTLIKGNIARYGGIVAATILIAFGIGSIVTGFDGRDRIHDNLAAEKIVGTPDSTIPNQKVDTGKEAEAFAAVTRKHTLEATGGKVYAELPRAVYKDSGKPVPDEQAEAALKSGEAINNPLRDMWLNQISLSTALNTAYFAESVSTFAIVMGFALLLTGVGFGIVSIRLLRRREEADVRVPAAGAAITA